VIRHYILVGREVMEVPLREWGEWFETNSVDGRRHVGDDTIGGVRVSTVFLGLDHDFWGRGPPLLFETMVFPSCDMIGRWSTFDRAEAEHAKVVAAYRAMAEVVDHETSEPPPTP
jgi:hypothetical protein